MRRQEYRMTILELIKWTFYTSIVHGFFAALILLVGSILAIPFSLDQVLHVSFPKLFQIYVLVFFVYIVLTLSEKITYVAFDQRGLTLRSLFREFNFTWPEIKSIDEHVRKPKFIGIGHGIGYHPFNVYLTNCLAPTAKRGSLIIRTTSKTFPIELSLKSPSGITRSFGPETGRLLSELRNFWKAGRQRGTG